MQQGAEHSIPLAGVLKQISAHLDTLAANVFSIEEAVAETVSNARTTTRGSISDLQKLDFLRQSLEDTALLLHLLSHQQHMSGTALGEVCCIASKLKLNTTQALLSFSSEQATQKAEVSGDLDLF